MKTKHLPILASLILSFAPSPSSAQNPQAVQQLEQRLQQLEAQNALLEKKLDFKATVLDTAYAQRLKSIEQKISDDSTLIRITLIAISLLSVGTILTLLFGASKYAEKKAEEKISTYFASRAEAFRAMVHDYQREVELRRSKRIRILHAPNAKTAFLELFFADREFQDPIRSEIGSYTPSSADDLIFFNDESGNLPEELIYQTANRTPMKVVCFYFGPKKLTSIPEDLRIRFSFANAAAQLYNNLINALRSQDLLSRYNTV